MSALLEHGEEPIRIEQTTVRGTISNHSNIDIQERLKADEKKLDKPNIQRIEIAHLPIESDTLVIKGSIIFLSNSLHPHACNNEDYAKAHSEFIQAYAEKGGFEVLAERYFMNLINGRILWRNRYAKKVTITVEIEKDSHTFDLNEIDSESDLSIKGIKEKKSVDFAKKAIKKIAQALKGALGRYTVLPINITAHSTLGFGQDVYPSQEFTEKTARGRSSKDVSRVLAKLYHAGKSQAILHSQKVGNAIRTIDNWYEDKAFYPIAVEPYGVDQMKQKALRQNKNDFYTYLSSLEQLTEEIKKSKSIPNKVHFTAACFIRGGVFSHEKTDKKK